MMTLDISGPTHDEMGWPIAGPSFNQWNLDFKRFSTALAAAKGDRWWCVDPMLKYLSIRVDTRENRFKLRADGPNGSSIDVSPMRVLNAIDVWAAE